MTNELTCSQLVASLLAVPHLLLASAAENAGPASAHELPAVGSGRRGIFDFVLVLVLDVVGKAGDLALEDFEDVGGGLMLLEDELGKLGGGLFEVGGDNVGATQLGEEAQVGGIGGELRQAKRGALARRGAKRRVSL